MTFTITKKSTLIIISILGILALSLYAGKTLAQLNSNALSGVYGCTMRDDRWGREPEPGRRYDVSGLVWILDATNKKASGIDMRYTFTTASSGLGEIVRESERTYKDEPVQLLPTDLMNVYKMSIDEDGFLYLVATNGGNTLLVTEAGSRQWVSQSGICQKM